MKASKSGFLFIRINLFFSLYGRYLFTTNVTRSLHSLEIGQNLKNFNQSLQHWKSVLEVTTEKAFM